MIIDSDILIYFLKGNETVVHNLLLIKKDELFTTRINYSELLFGAFNSHRVSENLERIHTYLSKFHILEFDKQSSEIFAELKANLKKQGNIIADMDLMIASITIAHNKTLVTNNLKHFQRLTMLKIKNWL